MKRRSFFTLGGLCAVSLPALAFQEEKSKLKITGVRIVQTRPKRPVPSYTPAPGSWSTSGVEVANPMSIYPEYKPQRSLAPTSATRTSFLETVFACFRLSYIMRSSVISTVFDSCRTKRMPDGSRDFGQGRTYQGRSKTFMFRRSASTEGFLRKNTASSV